MKSCRRTTTTATQKKSPLQPRARARQKRGCVGACVFSDIFINCLPICLRVCAPCVRARGRQSEGRPCTHTTGFQIGCGVAQWCVCVCNVSYGHGRGAPRATGHTLRTRGKKRVHHARLDLSLRTESGCGERMRACTRRSQTPMRRPPRPPQHTRPPNNQFTYANKSFRLCSCLANLNGSY